MTTSDAPRKAPLDGIRVLEFSIGIAGPTFGRYLAHYGADTIRVESRRKPDSLRLMGSGWMPPTIDIRVRGDTTPLLNVTNTQKRSLGLEATHPTGRAILDKLLASTDILVSNLSVDVLPSWGLDYDGVRALKPDIIYVTLPGFGSGPGPYRNYRTWGPNQAPVGGIDYLTGWPDRGPGSISISYPDYIAGYHALVAALAALLHRDATGEGQQIDLSQFETTLTCIGPALLQYLVTGEVASRTGNRHLGAAPQGIYPTRDHERWVAISVLDDDDWTAFCIAANHIEWLDDPRFGALPGRLQHHDELDALIGAWTSGLTAWEVTADLQDAGVAAAPVNENPDLLTDEHLAARRFWKALPHARFGRDLVVGHPITMSGTPARFDRASPALGEDTRDILGSVAGLSEAEIDAAVAEGAAYLPGEQDMELERPYLHWIRHVMNLPWPESRFDPAAEQMARLLRHGAGASTEDADAR